MSVRLSAVLLLVSLLALTSCSHGGPPEVVGDKLVLPGGCKLVRMSKENSQALPEFVRFDAKYPAGWPEQLELPAGSFILHSGRILVQESSLSTAELEHYTGYQAIGLVDLTYDEALTYFENSIKSLGLDPVHTESYSPFWGTKDYRIHLTPIVDNQSSRYNVLSLSIPKYTDLGEWSCYLFQISIKQ